MSKMFISHFDIQDEENIQRGSNKGDKSILNFVEEIECLLWGVKEQRSGPGFVLESFVWNNTALHRM